MTREGTFILADICGYTPFLTGVAIEHAKEITSDLFNALLKVNRGRWKVANIEGDCIFFYGDSREAPDELLAHAQTLYRQFCNRVLDIAARSSCPCGACSRTNQLGLKFVVHVGEFDVQQIGRRRELIGADIVIAHRLLKNSVPIEEYVLLTQNYADAMTPPKLPAERGRDEYEDIGPVEYTYLDLESVRSAVEAENVFFLTPDQARIRLTIDIDAPPDLVWDAVIDPEKLVIWTGLKESVDLPGRHGRIGEIHRCTAPNGRVLIRVTTAMDEAARRITEKYYSGSRHMKDAYATTEVCERSDGGSHFGFYMTFKEAIPVFSHVVCRIGQPLFERSFRKELQELKAYCESGAKSRPGPADVR